MKRPPLLLGRGAICDNGESCATESGGELMAINETLLPEYDQEIATTRRLLERVPATDPAWRPHPKSYALGDLAVHVATLPSWMAATMTLPELDFANVAPPASFTTVEALLAYFDKNAAAGRAALARAADADFAVPWTLKNAGAAIFTLPRAVVLRSFVLSHLIHHRAQLGVYLRLRGVPLPPSYGPTADTGM
jgi:uncharacterized damage-inducible protein DinB